MKRLIIILIVTASLLLSCGGADTDKVVIKWWHFWTDTGIKPVIEEIVADFEKTHPNVDVQLVDLTWADGHDKIAIAFSAGSGPDVVELGSDWIPEFSSTGHLLDLTERTESLKNQFLNWEPGIYEGKRYAFPWILGTRILYSNDAWLSMAGYSLEYSPKYWTEFLTACKRINALGEDVYGFGSNSAERHRLYKKFLPFMWSNGGRILSADGTQCLLNSQENVEALHYYLDLCETGLTDTQRRLEDTFLEGKIGFVISGDWLLRRIKKEKPEFGFSTHVLPVPSEGRKPVSFAGGEYLCINVKSEHPDIALELVKHICSPVNQLKFCRQNNTPTPSSIMATQDTTFTKQQHFDTFIEQLKTSLMAPAHPKWVYIEAEVEKAVEEALYKAKTPQEALDDATDRITEILSQ